MTSLASSLEKVVDQLAKNRNIPKYQFERAVEPFIGIFLEEALERYLNVPMTLVVLEFPLKKSDSNQSTNVDFLFRAPKTGDWYLVELKTERETLCQEQLAVYQSRVGSNFSKIMKHLGKIERASKSKEKYRHLRSEIEKHQPLDGKVQVLYITPHVKSPMQRLKGPKIHWCSFDELFDGFESVRHPELWKFVSKLVKAI